MHGIPAGLLLYMMQRRQHLAAADVWTQSMDGLVSDLPRKGMWAKGKETRWLVEGVITDSAAGGGGDVEVC